MTKVAPLSIMPEVTPREFNSSKVQNVMDAYKFLTDKGLCDMILISTLTIITLNKTRLESVMEKKEWNQLWRIPLAVSAIIGIVYLIIYLFTGSIPVVDKLTLFKDPMWGLPPEYELPFPMSRAWDVAFAFIFGVLMVRAIQCTEKYDENLPIGLGFRFASGLIFGSASGLIFVSGFGFVSGLVGFGFGFVSGLKFGLKLGIGFGIGFGLGFGFVSSLVVGFGFGLALILVVGLMFCLGVSLGFGLKCLFSKSFWKKIITWLAGE